MTTVRTLFDAAAANYDSGRRLLIPCFDDFYGTVAELVAAHAPIAPRILDLGAGTGLLSAVVAGIRPQARLVLTDLAEAMLDKARQRFAGRADTEYRVMDHLALSSSDEFDVVVSGLSIHHLEDDGKRDLYARAARALKPGGLLVNADPVAGDRPEMDRRYWRHWYDAAKASGIAEAELEAAVIRQQLDRRAPLAPQLEWLRQAGLTDVECRYKNVSFAVLCGLKPVA